MDELISAVSKQAGLPEAQARKAAEAVIEFLKEKLPAPLAGQIDGLLGQGNVADGADNLIKKGMGLFGKK